MLVFGSNSASTGYNLTRSLRLRRSATAYLNRTMTTPTDGKMWTYSVWRKLGDVGAAFDILLTARPGASAGSMQIVNGVLRWYGNATVAYDVISSQTWRDPSAWYHFVFVYDTTQATAANRIKYYVNGVQGTFSSATYPTLNSVSGDFNAAHVCQFGADVNNGRYSDGEYAEAHFIDGQALTPSSFGSTNALTGVWQPAAYTGSYGTNGFYLPFTDNSALTTSSNVGLGKDFSGNGNYWVTNNISITAGVTYDSMTDVPTLTSATAANFAVLNPLFNASPSTAVLSNGNLTFIGNYYPVASTIGVSSGKYYFEATVGSSALSLGIVPLGFTSATGQPGSTATSYSVQSTTKYNNGSVTSYGSAWSTGNIIGIALDLTAGTLVAYVNNVSQGTAFSGIAGTYFFAMWNTTTSDTVNFGQRPFTYTPPTGFVALNTYNLPTSTIVKGNTVMDATLWAGNSSTQSIVNAAAFKTDFVWIKNRTGANSHALFDSVRGATKRLYSDATLDEQTEATTLTAFNSNGFSVSTSGAVNASANNYVGWQWQAGQGTTSSNTNGTITSTVSVNASAGFSVVTFTGTGAAGTVGHGLGVAPSMYIIKQRSATGDWFVYHQSVGATAGLFLNLTTASTTNTYFNNTSPTSSVFSIGTAGGLNANGVTAVAYCWTTIAGYSSFGAYSGNGSTDGPMIYTGFQPKFVLLKNTNTSIYDWWIYDSIRNSYNQANLSLQPDLSSAETNNSNISIDTLSNGFKLRGTNSNINGSGNSYIYAAFATSPFKNSLAF